MGLENIHEILVGCENDQELRASRLIVWSLFGVAKFVISDSH